MKANDGYRWDVDLFVSDVWLIRILSSLLLCLAFCATSEVHFRYNHRRMPKLTIYPSDLTITVMNIPIVAWRMVPRNKAGASQPICLLHPRHMSLVSRFSLHIVTLSYSWKRCVDHP